MPEFFARPWGGYKVHAQGPGWTLKTLYIKAGEATSLQSHREREERWVLVEGEAYLSDGEHPPQLLELHKEVCIPLGARHRLMGGKKDGVVVELMRGNYREDDIERYEDKYGRV